MNMLLDTGASRSLISCEKFQELCDRDVKLSLGKTEMRLTTASGEILVPAGAINVHLDVGGFWCTHSVLVADLNGMQGVLGMDVLGPSPCTLELSLGCLMMGNFSISLHREAIARGYLFLARQEEQVFPHAMVLCDRTVDGVR